MQHTENKITFTIRNILKLWYIPVFSFVPMAFPFGLFYIGMVAKNNKWKSFFIVSLLILAVSIYMLSTGNRGFQTVGVLLLIFNWLFVVVYMIITAREFIHLSLARSHSYPTPADTASTGNKKNTNKEAEKEVDAVTMGNELIRNLEKWKKEIESIEMKQDITELIKLSSIVMQRNDEDSRKFFLRYSDRLNNTLAKYDEIENTRIYSPEMKESMHIIEKSTEEIVIVFRNEINKMYKKDLLDLNAETVAFMQELRNKGLID